MPIPRKRVSLASAKKAKRSSYTSVISIYEAKTHFSRLLDRVARGEEIVIARDGEPIARLVPISQNRFAEILGRDEGKIPIAEDFDDPEIWTDEERAIFGIRI
jgi:prevent-host-death family protein